MSIAFVFPSATDTWGNVAAEAAACRPGDGQRRPQENIRAGETGLVYRADNVQDLTRVLTQMADKSRCVQMGAAAHAYAQTRSFEESFRFGDSIRQGNTASPPPRPDRVRSFLKAL